MKDSVSEKISDALRNYQQEMIDRLEEAWRRYRSVMLQMPTGTGKTVLMAEIIRQRISRISRKGKDGILIVAHRRELLEQIRGTVKCFGIDMEKNRIVVESIQKLSRILGQTDNTKSTDSSLTRTATNGHKFSINPSLVIIDEAHHALAKTYRMLWDRWPKAKFLGLTATPCRLNNEGFMDLFDVLVQSHSIQEFINMGWLSDFDYVTAEPDNPILKQVASLKKRGVDGDYQTREMALVMDCEESIENLYRAYRQFVNGKKGIVYAIDRNHARHITDYYQRQGVNCAMIDSKTPKDERDRIVEEYRNSIQIQTLPLSPPLEGAGSACGRSGACGIDVLVNVDIFGEGFDVPEVEFIQLARPTLSLSKYLQQVGRGMRIAEEKDRVVILDHVGMYQSFGLPTEDWDWLQMFSGKMAGRAGMGRESLLYVRDGTREKELVSTHMVNIKRKDEEHRGLEVFIRDGLYGIAKDGRMIHQPLFQQVRKADDGFFAYCTYPYLVYKSRVTIIDKDGRDLGLRMYGSLEWEGASLLKGQGVNGETLYWDRYYNNYYHEKPVFETVGGVEMVRLKAGYVLRKYPALIKPTMKRDIYYNKKVVWMNDWLIAKYGAQTGRGYSPRKILSYGQDRFYVRTEERDLPGVTVVDMQGNVVGHLWTVPADEEHNRPQWKQTPLVNANTRMGKG